MKKQKTMAQDAIFNITRGKVRPTKHLQLGIAIKSIIGNRKRMYIYVTDSNSPLVTQYVKRLKQS